MWWIALDGLDQVKKGTSDININSRESIRYFDRIQNGLLSVRGITFQTPAERFEAWKEVEEYLVPGTILPGRQQQKSPTMRPVTPVSPRTPVDSPGFSPPRNARIDGNPNGNGNGYGGMKSPIGNGNGYGGMKSPNGNGNVNGNNRRSNTFPLQQTGRRYTNGTMDSPVTPTLTEPPRRIQQLINCVLYRKHKSGKRDSTPPGHQQLAKRPEIHLVTNSPEIAAWARAFDISVMSSNQLEDMVEREDFIYQEKLKDFQEAQLQAENGRHSNGVRGGRGGRGGHRGGGGGGGRNGHGGRGSRVAAAAEPDFVFVREAPRGVARGKGKLWEP